MDFQELRLKLAFIKAAQDPIAAKVVFIKKAAGLSAMSAVKAVGKGAGKFVPVVGSVLSGGQALGDLGNAASHLANGNLGGAAVSGVKAVAHGAGVIPHPIASAASFVADFIPDVPVASSPGLRHNTPSGLVNYNPMQ